MELLPCPFCGAGTTRVVMNGQTWTGTKYSDPISVSVVHHCDPIEGQPSRQIERIGRDAESAIAAWNLRSSPASAPEGFAMTEPTLLPDGSGFGIMSFPLPKDHWIYKEREYEDGAIEPNDLPAPILTHSFRRQVIAAIRYAVRSATNCGKEDDFDPDALVQNAVYALCGPYGKAAPTPPVSEDRWQPIETAPKDGSKFLAWRRHSTIPLIVFYNAEYDQYECNDGNLVYSLTHWMPLPKAPAMQEDKP